MTAKKVTSARLSKLAGKYAAMSDAEMLGEADFTRPQWRKFCANVRALAASVLSQTEKAEPKKKARK